MPPPVLANRWAVSMALHCNRCRYRVETNDIDGVSCVSNKVGVDLWGESVECGCRSMGVTTYGMA